MKIRLLDDSIRLRLQRNEVDALHRDGRLEATTRFGPDPDSRWTCVLERDPDAAPVRVRHHGCTLTVGIAGDAIADLAGTDRVGIEAHLPLPAGDRLALLIEKDFKCLTPRAEDADAYPHPASSTGHAC